MNLGNPPLKVLSGRVLCSCCNAHLPSPVAGSPVEATYTGPTLERVIVKRGGKVVHDCDATGGEEL